MTKSTKSKLVNKIGQGKCIWNAPSEVRSRVETLGPNFQSQNSWPWKQWLKKNNSFYTNNLMYTCIHGADIIPSLYFSIPPSVIVLVILRSPMEITTSSTLSLALPSSLHRHLHVNHHISIPSASQLPGEWPWFSPYKQIHCGLLSPAHVCILSWIKLKHGGGTAHSCMK